MLREGQGPTSGYGLLERRFDIPFVAALAQKEKQIQQNYRPVIGVHKWFARRPGALFRSLFLSEFSPEGALQDHYFKANSLKGLTIFDPFMGGGTPVFEANRLGMNVVGCDVNPMAYWIVHQELAPCDRKAFRAAAEAVITDIQEEIGGLYQTTCTQCGERDATVKYFLWVKQQRCAQCRAVFDLSPGSLVAKNQRHPNYVYHCPHCHELTEESKRPDGPIHCRHCSKGFSSEGTVQNRKYTCPSCAHEGRYPTEMAAEGAPQHRLFAMEYHCERCKPHHTGRFFKAPDPLDLDNITLASKRFATESLPVPDDAIPDGVETKRLHRWGYRRFRDLFNERQLLGLGLLSKRIKQVNDRASRKALATVFSDILRYQNMLCRYDTMALKCQDIFSVHGFPVGLVQCENNLLGIPRIGSGGFRHFVEKYDRAKAYCELPFETTFTPSGRKRLIPVHGEKIVAQFTFHPPVANPRARRLAYFSFIRGDPAPPLQSRRRLYGPALLR